MISFEYFERALDTANLTKENPLYIRDPEGRYRHIGKIEKNNEGTLQLSVGTVSRSLEDILQRKGAWIEWKDLEYPWEVE